MNRLALQMRNNTLYVGVGKVKIKRGNKNHNKTENSSLLGATKGKSIGLEKGTDIFLSH